VETTKKNPQNFYWMEDVKNVQILERVAAGQVVTQDDGVFLFACPHCGSPILVAPQEIACKQFVHGVLKATGQGVNPHASAQECADLLQKSAIHGCGQAYEFDGVTVKTRLHG